MNTGRKVKMSDETTVTFQAAALTDFCIRVFRKLDVPEDDARIAADVLVSADRRGIESHGMARLRIYVDGIQHGRMIPRPEVKIIRETPTTALIDAGAGLAQPVSYRAMQKAIQKAEETGVGFVTVRNSNHYGIAGYYAMMALESDCIGISMTNTNMAVVPTFGRNAILGTNPIAVAAPANEERPFVLDMATSTVARGKLEVYNRKGKSIPKGWATDERGLNTEDANRVLENMNNRRGGGLLPLGGEGELLSGYKGYGLALWVEIFCGILSGSAYATLVYPTAPDGRSLPPNLGHFFGAWRVDAFRPADEFKAAMDDLQRQLRNSPKAEGQDRIYIHGEKEYEKAELYTREGIPLNSKVVKDLQSIARTTGVKYDLE
jgi:L-2-hydroxycarboxylate dehydrogenase (NAD+)